MKMEKRTLGLIKKSEEVVDKMFKERGLSVIDLLNIDSKTGAAIGSCMELYKDSKDYIRHWARTIDHMERDLIELRAMNRELREQNKCLECMLQRLSRQLEADNKKEEGA